MTFRKFAGLATALLMIAAMVPLLAAPALGASVAPELIEGNQNCGAVTGLEELTRFDPVASGTQAGVTITVKGDSFDWSSTVTIAAVFVKGGPNGNLYDYRPDGSTGDTGLHAPTNSSGGFAGLSHITFCVPDDTTTTTEDTTTTTEATTTTERESTTTTERESTTTTEGESTTTTEGESTTTTEGESTTTTEATTTTEQESTTTTTEVEVEGETTSTTEAEVEEETTSTTEGDETEDTLPFTGIGTDGMALAALIALASGAGLIFLTRRSAESEIDG